MLQGLTVHLNVTGENEDKLSRMGSENGIRRLSF